MTWDVTVSSTLAPTESYVEATSRTAGAAAELADVRKSANYSNLEPTRVFQPLDFENLGPMNESAKKKISELGQKIVSVTGGNLECRFLFQRMSISVQRFNAILLHDSSFDSLFLSDGRRN